MADIKVFEDLLVTNNIDTSGTVNIKTETTFSAIQTTGDNMYSIDGAIQSLDQTIVQHKQNIKNAYEYARFKRTGSFDANGEATINLTSTAVSGGIFFNTTNLNNIDIQVLIDTNGEFKYRNDLVSVNLYSDNGSVILNMSSPGSPLKSYRVFAINEKEFLQNWENEALQIVVVVDQWNKEIVLSASYIANATYTYGYNIKLNSSGNFLLTTTYNTNPQYHYLYETNSSGWQQRKVFSLGYAEYNDLCTSCDISADGKTVVFGSPYDESGSSETYNGLVYVFASSSGVWEQTILTGSHTNTGLPDYFGQSVAINSSGNRIVAGAWFDETGSVNNAYGLAYVFISQSSGWSEQKVLTGSISTGSGVETFGYSVAINSTGNIIVVGAPNDEISATTNTGLVYIFNSGSSGWVQQKILTGSLSTNANDAFGYSLSINSVGNKLVVGAPCQLVTNQATDLGPGLAYIFKSNSSGWVEEQVLSGAHATNNDDKFGWSVAMNSAGNKVVIGAPQDESGSMGITSSGLAYVFISQSNGWVQQKVLSGTYAIDNDDRFGNSVSIDASGSRIAVGAPNDENPYLASGSGVTYVFTSASIFDGQEQIISQNAVTYNSNINLKSGLLAYYDFNYNISDFYSNKHLANGINSSGVQYGDGKLGRGSVYFDGTNCLKQTVNNGLLTIGTTWSVSMWIKIVNKTGWRALFGLGDTTAGAIVLDNGLLGAYKSGFTSFGYYPALSVWNHFVFICQGNTWTAYVNGSGIIGTGMATNKTFTGIRAIGAQGDGNNKFSGYIDEMYLWNRAITYQESVALYNYEKGLKYADIENVRLVY